MEKLQMEKQLIAEATRLLEQAHAMQDLDCNWDLLEKTANNICAKYKGTVCESFAENLLLSTCLHIGVLVKKEGNKNDKRNQKCC